MSRRKNPSLKLANTVDEYTPDMIRELKRCANDPVYFATTYGYVKHPYKGKVRFDMYEYQKEMMRSIDNNQYNIILSARQTGKCCISSVKVIIAWFNFKSKLFFIKKILLYIFNKPIYNALIKNI